MTIHRVSLYVFLVATVGMFASGCGHVNANYPRVEKNIWVNEKGGPSASGQGLYFQINEISPTPTTRGMMDSLEGSMTPAMGSSSYQSELDRAAKNKKLFFEMLNDKDHVFYRGSLSLLEYVEVRIVQGCLLLTIETPEGLVEARDEGIIFPSHSNRNNFEDTSNGPVDFNLSYNRVELGNDNRLFVRCKVLGSVKSVSIDSSRIVVRDVSN